MDTIVVFTGIPYETLRIISGAGIVFMFVANLLMWIIIGKFLFGSWSK